MGDNGADRVVVRRLINEIGNLGLKADPVTFAKYLSMVALQSPRILSTRSLYPADNAMRGTGVFKTWGDRLTIDFDRDSGGGPYYPFGLARELYCRNVYLRPFRPFTATGATVVDLGGNVGMFTALAATSLKPARIFYVEPQTMYLDHMKLLAGPLSAAEIVPLAGFAGSAPPGETLLDLNAVLAAEQRIAFMKADIEGGEEALFRDAGAWLDQVERIGMEAHPAECDTKAVADALAKRGFIVRPTDNEGLPVASEHAFYMYAARQADSFR
jgi:hypothetical protein